MPPVYGAGKSIKLIGKAKLFALCFFFIENGPAYEVEFGIKKNTGMNINS
jgi:hypothetical protein